MATSLAETYYLKALENYPWELSETLENLTYALSYDDQNSAANCLMGRLHMNDLKDYQSAEYYFEKAISSNPYYDCTYSHMISLYIRQRQLIKAERLLRHAQRIPTISRSHILCSMSQIMEIRGELKLAKSFMNSAMAEVLDESEQEFVKNELHRLKAKQKALKKVSKLEGIRS